MSFRHSLASLVALISLSFWHPARADAVFTVDTLDDDLRVDSEGDWEIELDDGRLIGGYTFGRIADRTHSTFSYVLPAGTSFANVRYARLYFGPAGVGPVPRDIPAMLWSGDQWKVNYQAVVDGHTLATIRSLKFEHPGWWSSGPFVAQRLPMASADHFRVWVYTGNDDLRTSPSIRPNSEIEICANMIDGSSVKLDTGRSTHHDFVGTGDSAFAGSFKDWQLAGASAATPRPLILANIRNFTVFMVGGRSADRGIRGTDPFRGDDEWVLNGFLVGLEPTPFVPSAPFGGSRRLFSQVNVNAKLNRARPFWTSDIWHAGGSGITASCL